MLYKKIQGTELYSSAICLGTDVVGSMINEERSFELLNFFEVSGGNFLDSAHIYADWLTEEKSTSEKTIGRWMKSRGNRGKMIIGTKGGHFDQYTGVARLSYKEITDDLDESLQFLQSEYIDIYWLHRDDPGRPIGEILETLNKQKQKGKIRYFGCSNWKIQRIRETMVYAEKHGLDCFIANQLMWSYAVINTDALQDKTIVTMDAEMLELHKSAKLAAVPFSSQARGFFKKANSFPITQLDKDLCKVYVNDKNMNRLKKLEKLSNETSIPINELALGYLVSQPFTTIPIVGCKTVEQLAESVKAGDLMLDANILDYLAAD